MNDNIKQNVKDILEGKATVEEAQKYLSEMDGNSDQDIFSDEKFTHLLDNYNKKNELEFGSVPFVSDNEKNKIWDSLIKKHNQASVFTNTFEKIKNAITEFFTFEDFTLFNKNSFALAALLVIFVIPVVFQIYDFDKPQVTGMRGDDLLNPEATISFAIVDKTPTLTRPDRILTENDMIAFRINLESDRYCSVYVLFQDQIDQIITNKLFSKGTHDLDLGYKLLGNSGENKIILLNSAKPIMITEHDKQKLIREVLKNNISSLTIEKNHIGVDSKTFNVQ